MCACTDCYGGGDGGSEEPPSCKSFEFKKVGNLNFQEAGVKNIGTVFTTKTPQGNKSVGLYIGYLYFGLPVTRGNNEFYSTSRASKISAEALGNAIKSTDSYSKQNPYSINVDQHFMNSLETEMKKYGGTVSKYPSEAKGYTPNMKDFKNYWFVDEVSCWN